MNGKAFWWLSLTVVSFALLLAVSCGDDDDDDNDDDTTQDCQALYQTSVAAACMDYDFFEFYGCTDEEGITDPECFLACVDAIDPAHDDGKYLCYDAERCVSDCSQDDASGCENAYYGMPNQECIDYREFFVQTCDARHDADLRNCALFCYENEPDCTSFTECLLGCGG